MKKKNDDENNFSKILQVVQLKKMEKKINFYKFIRVLKSMKKKKEFLVIFSEFSYCWK